MPRSSASTVAFTISDWVAQLEFDAITGVRDNATAWMWSYNRDRPNMALAGITPKERQGMGAWSLLLAPN